EKLDEEVAAIADQLAASAPIALAGILDTILEGNECAIDQGLDYEAQAFGNCFSTEDMREGTKAFMERRKPTFTGR
ncbi:MAG TPA: enoyl-CoA hydratase-related protein, partial [Rhodanobacteraceae bacterium]|nr:enoyl-CoA hydratase-related protein [Rhodanobacteraceae bacterium]